MTPGTQGQLQGFSLGWCLEAAHYLHGSRSCLNPHCFLLHTSFQKYIGNAEPSHAENVRLYTPNLISPSPQRHIFQILSVILCGELHLVLCCRSQADGVKPPRSQAPHTFPHNYFQDKSAPVFNTESWNSQARKFMQENPSFIPPKYDASVLIKWVHYFLLFRRWTTNDQRKAWNSWQKAKSPQTLGSSRAQAVI